MPIWFREVKFEGDEKKRIIYFETQDEFDELWGPIAKMEISLEKKDRLKYFHAREVQKSIDAYNAIKVVVTQKEISWVRSHEFTFWYGQRMKMIKKSMYPERCIHGIFYCEISERQFDLHTTIIRDHFEGFKSYIIDAYNSFICH